MELFVALNAHTLPFEQKAPLLFGVTVNFALRVRLQVYHR
jgi:hypothetical protein